MKTYLSIDCDYFAVEEVSGKISAKRLLDILDLINKPIFVTLGHDLHAFDVNRHKVERVINVDYHSDFQPYNENHMIELLEKYPDMQPYQLLETHSTQPSTRECRLTEYNWVNFCVLHGKRPLYEHWRPNPGVGETFDCNEFTLANGAAKYKHKHIEPRALLKQLSKIKNDIVAVGIAISPSWCDTAIDVRHDTEGPTWAMDFFNTLMPVLRDTTLFSYFWAHKEIYSDTDKRRRLSEYPVIKKRTQMCDNVWYKPGKYTLKPRLYNPGWYELVSDRYTIRIEISMDVPFHLPSVKRAAVAFSQW
jgi:hypothetical protein